ncbi:MAG: fluoride efflux transporter CrcB [Alphaproteobacteria bacterium]
MNILLAVFLGGGAGSVARLLSMMATAKLFGDAFPYGTLFVNVLGSFAIGVIMQTVMIKADMSATMQALLVTGFLGGFTTFSAFSFDVYKLANTGQALNAALYVAASVFLSLLAVFGGAASVKAFS